MRSCQTTLKPLLRSLAVLTLAVFVVAQWLCFVHCHSGDSHGDRGAEILSCHSTAATHSHHDEDKSSSPKPLPMGSCATLQTLLASNGALTSAVPEFVPLYTLTSFALALGATEIESTASISRHAGTLDWIFTPEVSLGPAYRSHAPPLLS